MTLDEAQTVLKILSTADSGCSVCVSGLADRFRRAFPEFAVELEASGTWFDPFEWSTDPEDGSTYKLFVVTPAA